MDADAMQRATVRFPPSLLEAVESEAERLGYRDRTEFIREACRRMIHPDALPEVDDG